MSEHPQDEEISHVPRVVLRRPVAWAARDAEGFREQLEELIEELAGDLMGGAGTLWTVQDTVYEENKSC